MSCSVVPGGCGPVAVPVRLSGPSQKAQIMVDMYYFVSCLYIQLVPLCALDLSADELLIGWERTTAATAAKFGAWAP